MSETMRNITINVSEEETNQYYEQLSAMGLLEEDGEVTKYIELMNEEEEKIDNSK